MQNRFYKPRRRERFEYEHKVLCFKHIKVDDRHLTKVPIPFTIYDISYSGLGISSKQRIDPNTTLIFNMTFDGIIRELKADVMWCNYRFLQHSSHRYKCGLEFKELTYDDILFLHRIIKNLGVDEN